MKTLLSAVGIVAGLLCAVYALLYALFDGLSTGKTAAIVLLGILALVAGALLVMWVTARMWRTRMTTERTETAIDGQWHELENYRAPVAALPPARYITVPKYQVNGASQPLGLVHPATPATPATILTTSTDGGALEIPLSKLMRFLALATPARSEWVGDRSAYGAALAFCEAHGLLDRQSNGGATWRGEYPPEARRTWAMQFDQVTRE